MSALNSKKTFAKEGGSLFALVDKRLPSRCCDELMRRGFSIIKVKSEKRLPEPLASHTDMLFFRHNNTLITSLQYKKENPELFLALTDSLKGIKIECSDEIHGGAYPHDRIFNALAIGSRIFAKAELLSSAIVKYAEKNELQLIPVKQGYPACVALALPEGLMITSDQGLAGTARGEGLDTLVISESDSILLPPYKNGFIGGAAGVFQNTVYFIGNLNSHPEHSAIEKKLYEYGYSAVSLDPSADLLSDLGGIFFFDIGDKTTAKNGSISNPTIPKSV